MYALPDCMYTYLIAFWPKLAKDKDHSYFVKIVTDHSYIWLHYLFVIIIYC